MRINFFFFFLLKKKIYSLYESRRTAINLSRFNSREWHSIKRVTYYRDYPSHVGPKCRYNSAAIFPRRPRRYALRFTIWRILGWDVSRASSNSRKEKINFRHTRLPFVPSVPFLYTWIMWPTLRKVGIYSESYSKSVYDGWCASRSAVLLMQRRFSPREYIVTCDDQRG